MIRGNIYAGRSVLLGFEHECHCVDCRSGSFAFKKNKEASQAVGFYLVGGSLSADVDTGQYRKPIRAYESFEAGGDENGYRI